MSIYEQKNAETRRKFLAAAFELFTWNGYGPTSMHQIAKHAGGSRANLYLHFRNKPDLVLARMQEMEAQLAQPFQELVRTPVHSEETIRAWLERMKDLWRTYRVEFTTVEQAMSEDETVAAEWWSMIQRISNSLPGLEQGHRRQHFITLWMGLDRTFSFLYGRGHIENEERVLASLTEQWLALFGED
ncbi:TetR/AcrR family transcriptional regulator [Corynebacterium sp. A21]|uniref:TetR/AcrR family transcriptional regulator n=1 Tax=Corynebacterium sp. A21 TaxID=3457318 RepID=UPI003FD2BF1C